jgi:hypothetical protein
MIRETLPTVALRMTVGRNIVGLAVGHYAGGPTNECADMSGAVRGAVHADQAT